jgi:hypothetical protein
LRTTAYERGPLGGNDALWFELRMLFCDLCGRIIPKYLWQVGVDGRGRTFCDKACERLYRDCVLACAGPADGGATERGPGGL